MINRKQSHSEGRTAPKKRDTHPRESIVQAAQQRPDGISPSDLHHELGGRVSRRTLVRYLGELVRQGRLRSRGSGRARVYLVAQNVAEVASANVVEAYVPLSSAAKEVRDYVRGSIASRVPVGYDREFLDSYRPGVTAYLSESTRAHLWQIGRSPDVDRPAGTYARHILGRLLIDLSWASSRLEGNTYTQLDTERLINFGQAAEGRDAQEAQMILNHKAAIEFLIEQAEEIGFNRYTILNLHALLSDNLLSNPDASGRIRQIPVQISGTVFHPLSVPPVVNECFQQILDSAAAIVDPFEQAFFTMVQIPYLQPFEDVNKRVSRLAANVPLVRRNLCPLSFVDVPERAYVEGTLGVYELNRVDLLRDVFVWAYERSCQSYLAVRQSMAEPDPFRMLYREKMIEIIGEVVRQRRHDVEAAARQLASGIVPPADLDKFVDLAVTDLLRLHEGTIARYRIRPSEFRAWDDVRP